MQASNGVLCARFSLVCEDIKDRRINTSLIQFLTCVFCISWSSCTYSPKITMTSVVTRLLHKTNILTAAITDFSLLVQMLGTVNNRNIQSQCSWIIILMRKTNESRAGFVVRTYCLSPELLAHSRCYCRSHLLVHPSTSPLLVINQFASIVSQTSGHVHIHVFSIKFFFSVET